MEQILISQLADKIEDYSKSLIMQKAHSQLNVRIIWLENALFALQARFAGDATFQAVIAEVHAAVTECLEEQKAKNEGQARPKAYN